MCLYTTWSACIATENTQFRQVHQIQLLKMIIIDIIANIHISLIWWRRLTDIIHVGPTLNLHKMVQHHVWQLWHLNNVVQLTTRMRYTNTNVVNEFDFLWQKDVNIWLYSTRTLSEADLHLTNLLISSKAVKLSASPLKMAVGAVTWQTLHLLLKRCS